MRTNCLSLQILQCLQMPEGEITDIAVMKSTQRKFTIAIHSDKHSGSGTGAEHRKKVVLWKHKVALTSTPHIPMRQESEDGSGADHWM
jgi:hypothetical protein